MDSSAERCTAGVQSFGNNSGLEWRGASGQEVEGESTVTRATEAGVVGTSGSSVGIGSGTGVD